jgi:hypothetical protein
VLSIEHEDPVHSGSVEAVQRGLLMARDTLQAALDGTENAAGDQSGGSPSRRF